ncbi:MAG: prolipoprotein diacylglyceryl transferase [Clostridiales bacterium]|uniref:prolipoprotein diacylglyceryl transferase n=1 Tax=Clostridium sp. N3C TaxID=1776758 RepID=UPI00092E17CC|nr:prolipoprotein diacylglyceryl transferase [Clostridium sp. N3C]NLZ48936.1 prolipoprotein diacylglyceryl transferase [Clostridiales bacterium]SCN24292.1 Prolipoprotein diacylglyceryl transferase [Clostridium sp. N3C]
MNPVAFTIFGIDIRWYGILISIGMIAAVYLSSFTCKWRDVDFDSLFDVVILALPFGIIGARLYYVIMEFEQYKDNLWDIFNIRQGGLAIHGGLILAILTTYLYTRHKKYDFWAMADVAAPCIILAQAIGRWGNFMNGEAHGGEVTKEFISKFPAFIQKGMYINGSYYHPTFLYESLWNLLVCIILLILLKKSKRKGIVIFSYMGLYSIARYFIEALRTDSLWLGPFRVAQLVSIIGILLWLGFLIYIKINKEPKEKTAE